MHSYIILVFVSTQTFLRRRSSACWSPEASSSTWSTSSLTRGTTLGRYSVVEHSNSSTSPISAAQLYFCSWNGDFFFFKQVDAKKYILFRNPSFYVFWLTKYPVALLGNFIRHVCLTEALLWVLCVLAAHVHVVVVYHVTIVAIGHVLLKKFWPFGTRLRSTHCREFNFLKLCRPAYFT